MSSHKHTGSLSCVNPLPGPWRMLARGGGKMRRRQPKRRVFQSSLCRCVVERRDDDVGGGTAPLTSTSDEHTTAIPSSHPRSNRSV